MKRKRIASARPNEGIYEWTSIRIRRMGWLLFLVSFSSFAQSPQIRSTVDSLEMMIGDQTNLDLYIDVPTGTDVLFPQVKDTLTGQIELVEASIIDTTTTQSGITYHQRMVLTSFDTGLMMVPSLGFVLNGDSLNMLFSDSQTIYVDDVVIEQEAEIKDIKKPMDVPFNWKKYAMWALIGILIFAVLGGLIYFLWKKFGKKDGAPFFSKPKIPAHIPALKKLEEIRAAKLWQNDRTKEFHIAVSDTMRQYIEDRFGLDAMEQTTSEIMESLRVVELSDAMRSAIRKTLELADLVKFAKSKPLADENERSIETAFNFVNATLVMPLDEGEEEGVSVTETNKIEDVG